MCAQATHQFLTCMLSVRISSWPVCSVYASVPDLCAQCTHQFLTRILRVRISSWPVCSVYASVPDLYAQCTHQFLTCMLSVRISSWPVCSVYASASDAYAHCSACFAGTALLKIRLSICVRNFPDPNKPLNIFEIFYFLLTPRSPSHRDFIVYKSWKSEH